jgi:hypothetical protein
MSWINYLNDEMDDMFGFATRRPRLELPPQPTYIRHAPTTLNTTNNIRVESGSQVGQINAGAIVYLDRAVTTLNQAGRYDFASALQSFTQAVVEGRDDLTAESQKEVLDLLRGLIQELGKKPAERNGSIFRLALQSIGPLVAASTAITAHWDKLKVLFEALIH